jgi:hypothetical protein
MIILHGRAAAAPEDENVLLDLTHPSVENFLAHRQKGSRTYWWFDPE